ncbi:MAG: hypothetical protein AAF762_05975 [Pseudomonadota bacterium]
MTRPVLAAALALVATGALAQANRPFLDGALEATQDLGCIGIVAVAPTQTAADLAQASLTCLADGAYNSAVESFIAMQVFGVFDAQRVLDASSHQAIAVMGQTIAAEMDMAQQAAFQDAVGRFGGAGSARHAALCAHLRAIGPPEYFPRYMVQHGQEAFLYPDDDPIDPAFEPGPTWDAVLTSFLQCA